MSSNSEAVKKWRKNLKLKALRLFGGKCNVCGYNKCAQALEFHHLDPNKKDISLGSVVRNPKSWENAVEELKKCILVCSNCHREIHYGVISVENKIYINLEKNLSKNENFIEDIHDFCLCGKRKNTFNNFCSRVCSGKYAEKRISYKDKDKILSIVKMRDVDNLSFSEISSRMGLNRGTASSRLYKRYKKDKNEKMLVKIHFNGFLEYEDDENFKGNFYYGYNILEMRNKGMSNIEIGRKLNVSEAAVRKAFRIRE